MRTFDRGQKKNTINGRLRGHLRAVRRSYNAKKLKESEMFKGKTVLVTGSADGIGKETAMMLAQRGADLVLCDILKEKLTETTGEIRALGANCEGYDVDITKRIEVEKMVEKATGVFGKIDFLVNNAGGPLGAPYELEKITDEDWDRVLDVNLKGSFICCRAVVPLMVKNKSGSIVNVSSSSARDGGEVTGIAYVAAKAGVIGITRHLARRLAPFNIRVNSVAPGFTLTSESQRARAKTAAYQERLKKSLATAVMKRNGESREIASGICFLLSEEASFITGTTLDVNGGRYFS
jgi:NAD(P)-dependent dehydrogenase (short-subunit alcohol dehydrogenase family)